jgi:lipopolysaccharide/colanic/teichoic acid biosynthesis glycosyltransferase
MFLGDMTLIGNKSLSLHEAEQLTSDESISRFKEPIGLIGLWQGKSEKIEIDTYSKFQTEIWFAQEYDLWKERKF